MGLGPDDIAELKAAIPQRYRPAEGGDSLLPVSFAAASVLRTEATLKGGDPLASILTDPEAQAALVNIAHQLESGQIERSSVLVPTDDKSRRENVERRKAERQRSDQMLLTLLNSAERWSRELGERIENMARGFEADMGDAWREQIANRIMDPDEIPQRRDGESVTAYRERLEEALVDKMIDPRTGKIRPEYRDDPELRKYAEWALAVHQKREVDAYIARRSDPSLTDAQRKAEDRKFGKTATAVELREAAIGLPSPEASSTVQSELDQRRDTASSTASTEAAAFGI